MVKRGQRHMNYRYDAISPVDGRYYNETKEVRNYFSEPALIRARVHVEREYLRFLVRSGIAPDVDLPEFDVSVKRVKQIEKRVRHDVKAAELYLKEELEKRGKQRLKVFVHLGLTSEDVNSIAYALILKKFLQEILIPQYRKMIYCLIDIAEKEANSIMPARTHGMPAVLRNEYFLKKFLQDQCICYAVDILACKTQMNEDLQPLLSSLLQLLLQVKLCCLYVMPDSLLNLLNPFY